MRLELSETHLHSEFCDPNHKNGAWGTIVEIKNFSCSGGCRFRIKMPVPKVKGTQNLRMAFHLGIKRKKRGCQGFLNFVPKVELGDLKFGEQKFFPPCFSPNFGLREPKVFEPIEVQETHFRFEFQDSNPKKGAWGEKVACFDNRGLLQKNSQTTVLNVGKF